MPYMGEVWADKHQVSGAESGEIVAHHTVAMPVKHQCDLALRVKVPRRRRSGCRNKLTVKGFSSDVRDFFKDRLHGMGRVAGRSLSGQNGVV